MFLLKYISYLIFLHLIIALPQINLYYTHSVSVSGNTKALQQNCLRISLRDIPRINKNEIAWFCMSQLSSTFRVEKPKLIPKFTFAQLAKQNITSQQLYVWSAPIDLIEHYQFYLNQLSSTNNSSLLEKQVFYNCTLPRFGPLCQYELPYHYAYHSSLDEIIDYYYTNYEYNSSNLTCYMALKCDRGPYPACLDWSEICDGKIDCMNDGIDEAECWELEMNECEDDEYRCQNGQCIPISFYDHNPDAPDCIDTSDKRVRYIRPEIVCQKNDIPSFGCEDHYPSNKFSTTSHYEIKRAELLKEAIYSNHNSSISDNCWIAFKCLLRFIDFEFSFCDHFCENNTCLQIIKDDCPHILYFPTVPVLFGNIYFIYETQDLLDNENDSFQILFYICYTTSQYDQFFIDITKTVLNNMTCIYSQPYSSKWFPWIDSMKTLHEYSIKKLSELLIRYHLPFDYTLTMCNRSSMYQCIHSLKCISIYRLMDNIYDCPYMDDEEMSLMNNTHLKEHFTKTHFKCIISGQYIHHSLVDNDNCNCELIDYMWCEDEDSYINYLQTNVVFQHICDGFVDVSPSIISAYNNTDETECEQWACNNIYTRCNDVWNCLNGEDESGCILDSTLNCSSKHHLCVLPSTNEFICLPIEKTNDGDVDCLGATDEVKRCGIWHQRTSTASLSAPDFYCVNQSSYSCILPDFLCDGFNNCEHGDDEQFCTNQITENNGINSSLPYDYDLFNVRQFLLDYRVPMRWWNIIPFILFESAKIDEKYVKNMEKTMLSSSSIIKVSQQHHQSRCHRGLDLRVWLNEERTLLDYTCLCPASFYGDQCQYQQQRVSLTILFRALSDSWQTLFAIVISLIDHTDQRIIHSYEQISFLSIRDCEQKFNIYLLYSSQPKDPTNNYSIHIDFYEKHSLNYRGSILLPITFPFLPVHRLAFIVNIPRHDTKNLRSCLDNECVNGECIRYANNEQNLTFCRCDEGWSGRHCNIRYRCMCSSDSLCVGISSNNRSICVCPLHRFGPRCLLSDRTCEMNKNERCKHGGECISNVGYMTSNGDFTCICRKGYSGDRCEIVDSQLILSFDEQIDLSQSVSVHFIQTSYDRSVVRGTTLRSIPRRQDFMRIYWAQPFHLVFTEFLDTKIYYLTFTQSNYKPSTTINKTIYSSDRCRNINELFNQTFLQWDLIRRIKYYHLPCQNQSLNLSCFYDEMHLCLCYSFDEQRLSNCFKFDHNMTSDCFGQNECENDGRCFQDKSHCPTRSICLCPPCFYGRRCQFSTSGFGLSLDVILGYHIIPTYDLNQQPIIVKVTLVLTIIFVITGLINGIFSFITFNNKIICQVGCGLYLLGSSITTLLTTVMFGLKFFILIFTQMTIITNRSFLQVQCYSLDFLLRVCVCMDQWLNACVAVERAFTIIKGPRFSKRKSKQAAKYVITLLIIVVIGSCIHDCIYRHLIDEENDVDDIRRTWCSVSYSSKLQSYNSVIHIIHFVSPFIINLVSAIVLITKISSHQSRIHPDRSYQEIFREQFEQRKHLIISPIIIVILAFPRLIVIFISKCMKSSDDVWLYLIGYFISFIPPMLTFVIFILPSKVFKKELGLRVRKYRIVIQRYLQSIATQ